MMSFRTSIPVLFVLLLAVKAGAQSPLPASVARLSFVPHAAFFSIATKQGSLVDPQVFIAAPSAPAALGFQQIEHLAGIRNAEMSDDPTAIACDADGQSLHFDLQHWFAANGVVELEPPDFVRNSQRVVVRFANLVPRGRYSLFEERLYLRPPGFTPLDGNGKTNSFTATTDGTGGTTVVAPLSLTHADAIVLVYHADHADHGLQRGALGVDAFQQLIVRIP